MALKMTAVEFDPEMLGIIESLKIRLGNQTKSYVIRRGIELLAELSALVDPELDSLVVLPPDGKPRVLGFAKMLPIRRRLGA